jgi:surfeit locus 1 family protein
MPAPDWSFARRPAWLASHLFALAVVVGCVLLGLWQLDRLDQRQRTNDLVAERSARPEVPVADALAGGPPRDLEFLAVRDRGTYVGGEQVVVRNRSQGGAAGSWVVTPLQTESGPTILVNRGFVPNVTLAPADVPVPAGAVEVTGWLRRTQERAGIGPTHPEEGRLSALARIDVPRLDAQIPGELAPVWLQLGSQEPPPADGLPDPVPLPGLDEGNHLSYAVQWFTFATLGAVVYGLLLRRRASERRGAAYLAPPPDAVGQRV